MVIYVTKETSLLASSEMKRLVILLTLLFIEGCRSNSLPGLSELKRIHSEEWRLGSQDCSNKTGEYVRYLRNHGWDADALIVYSPKEKYPYHALARIKFKGDIFYVDPTFGRISRELSNAQVLREASDFELNYDFEWRKIRKIEKR